MGSGSGIERWIVGLFRRIPKGGVGWQLTAVCVHDYITPAQRAKFSLLLLHLYNTTNAKDMTADQAHRLV